MYVCHCNVVTDRDILESIETATDRCEDVANIIEGIVPPLEELAPPGRPST